LYWYDYNSNNHDNHHINHNYINHYHNYYNHNNHDHNNDDNNYHFYKMRKRLDGGWEQVFLLCIRSGKLLDRSHLLHRAWWHPRHH